MALIPAGEFMMGGDDKDRGDERPIHTVYLDEFYMDVYEVTNAQYQEFMKATGHKAPEFWNHPRFNAPDQPVMGVTWYDAMAYCEWVGKRLPTEAEWEKAARGGLVGKQYPWGDTWDSTKLNNRGLATTPVGCFPPNGYGLYDMSGNLWEWCADWYEFDYYSKSPKHNPEGPSSEPSRQPSRVVHGGSWLSAMNYLRVAVRGSLIPSEASYNLGFRCARDVTP
jgi:iron(II)-dependent oxidoreductase